MQSVEDVNELQKSVLVDKITKRYGVDLSGKTFALWGLAFKPNTDDMRQAPSRIIIQELVKRGARIQAYDPVAGEKAQICLEKDFKNEPQCKMKVTYGETMQTVLNHADALIIVTEWKAFRAPDFLLLKQELKDSVIFDGRNLYEPRDMDILGFEYHGIGRSTLALKNN